MVPDYTEPEKLACCTNSHLTVQILFKDLAVDKVTIQDSSNNISNGLLYKK